MATDTASSVGELTEADADRILGATMRRLMSNGGAPAFGLGGLCAFLAARAAALLPGCECLILLRVEGRPELLQVAGASGSWAETLNGRRWSVHGTALGQVLAEGHAREISGPGLVESFPESEPPPARCLALRIPPGGADSVRAPLGVLCIASEGHLGEAALRRAETFAGVVCLTLTQTEMQDSARRSASRLEAGLDLTVDLGSSLEPREVVRRLLRRAIAASGAERATLGHVEGRSLLVEGSCNESGQITAGGTRVALAAGGAVDQAVARRAPVIGGDLAAAVARHPVLATLFSGVRHSVTLPLMLKGEVSAVLVVSRRLDRPFSESEIAALEVIGGVAALALHNAELYSRAAALAIHNAELYQQAESASRSKSQFLNMVAHELRTPLTVVNGYLSMLGEGAFGEPSGSWARPVEVASAKTAELSDIVEDLLMAVRLEAGDLRGNAERLDLTAVVCEAVDRAQPRVRMLGAEMETHLIAEPVWIDGDAYQVGRILDILLGNALTYSDGQPWVRVSVEGGPNPRVLVEDHGRGIPSEIVEVIFEMFYRYEDPDSNLHPGTGLGLHLGRELAAAHGGALTLESSEVGLGSTFALTLPAARL